MGDLALGQSSSCANPALDVFFRQNGQLVDIDMLEYIIFENVTTPGSPNQIYPVTGRASVNLADCPVGGRLSTGRYVADWTPAEDAPTGRWQIQWFYRATPTSSEQTFTEPFNLLATPVFEGYCNVEDIRLEGASTMLTDEFIKRRILFSSRMIEKFTGRVFRPVSKVIKVDGRGHEVLTLDEPIISVNSVRIELIPEAGGDEEVTIDDLRIYNRHITQNLLQPDDRQDPRIEFVRTQLDAVRLGELFTVGTSVSLLFFPKGTQNIFVDGVFGYTDYDGTATGKTPDLVREACTRLTFLLLPKVSTSINQNLGPAEKERTRDQQVEYADPSRTAVQGAFTGDTLLDSLLATYRRPPKFGAA